MILSCQNINKSFVTDDVLKDVSFHLEEREKAALIGPNGAGKSTLLKIIMQEMPADSGEVIVAKGKTLGYLAQHQEVSGDNTIYGELLSVKQYLLDMEEKIRTMEQQMKTLTGRELDELLASYSRLTHQFQLEGGYACRSEVVGVLKGLGFEEEDFSRKIGTLSGGQKTRVALGRLLLSNPDIILLDEPTNHLDMESIAWLETYLINYKGAVFIVSHDRYFLDRVVTKIVEIDRGHVRTFMGNYSAYAEKKAMIRDAEYKAWLNQQQEIKHQEEVIAKLKSFNREKSIKRAESREKMLDKIDVLDKPVEENVEMHLELKPRVVSGNDVLTVKNLAKAFPQQELFSNVDFSVKRGERVAIIGANGTGKTTILKILNGLVEPDPSEKSTRKENDTILYQRILLYMKDHLRSQLTLDQICQANLVGKSQLQKLFQKEQRCGVIHYFSYLKIEEAKQMIRQEQANFTEISYALGYTSIHYFSRQFKTFTGMSPSEYALSIKALSEEDTANALH